MVPVSLAELAIILGCSRTLWEIPAGSSFLSVVNAISKFAVTRAVVIQVQLVWREYLFYLSLLLILNKCFHGSELFLCECFLSYEEEGG